MRIYTVGHSNRTLDDLIALLRTSGIRFLVDVRASPGSRRFPQFNRNALESGTKAAGIVYCWEGRDLGGRRTVTAEAEEAHRALSEIALRAYAAHMATADFRQALDRVLALESEGPVALMCAERDPAHCHRRLIADFLTACGHEVEHLITGGESRQHTQDTAARVQDDGLIYDRPTQGELGLD